MGKLEWKHVAPYLPYELGFEENGNTHMLSGIDTYIRANWTAPYQYKDGETVCYSFYDYSSMWSISEIKLILHPLSDLTKEIEVNGEKFVPIVELLKISELTWFKDHPKGKYSEIACVQNGWYAKAYVKYHAIKDINLHIGFPWNFPQWIIEKLNEWHIDWQELIKEGLAIDINTLKDE